MTNPPADEWLTDEEVAGILKVSRRTVETWRRAGRLPYYKLGRLVRFKATDLAPLLQAQDAAN